MAKEAAAVAQPTGDAPPPRPQIKGFKIPAKIGAAVDLYWQTREERYALDKQVKALEEKEKALKEHFINTIPKSDATGAAGKLCRVTIVTKEVPQVEDWDAVYAYIKKTGAFELLQKRLGDKAIQERWENHKDVPGVKPFTVVTISVNKV